MVTKGIITSIDFNGNTCQVRIPLFETAGNDPIIGTAVVSNTPGSYNGYKVDDVVLVAFEDGKMETPVVIGKLYLGAEKEKADPRGSLNTESLVAAKTAAVPADTKLTTNTDKNLPNTMNPYANLSSIANNLNKLNTDVNYLDVFTNNQFNSVITDVNKQGEQLRSEINQTASNIEAKVDKEHDSTTTGLGWNLTDTKWTIDATNTAWSTNKLTLFEVDRNGQVIINGNVRIGGYPQSRTRFYKKLAADSESPKAPKENTATEKLPDEGWYETYEWENTYHIWETIQTIIYDTNDKGELQLKITYSTPVDITGATGSTGEPATIYWASLSTAVHTGKNQASNIEIIPYAKTGNAPEVIDTTAYFKYSLDNGTTWNSDNWTLLQDNKIIILAKDIIADNIIVKLAHAYTDPGNSSNIIHSEYETETITYSPLNTPIIDLTNDTDVIKYKPDGNKITADVSSTAQVYLGGSPEVASYDWTVTSGAAKISKSNSNQTVTVTSITSDKAIITCAATTTNFKDENGKSVTITKDFVVSREVVVASYWLSFSPVHTGNLQQTDIEVKALAKIGNDSESKDTNAYFRYSWDSGSSWSDNGEWKQYENATLIIPKADIQNNNLRIQATHDSNGDDRQVYEDETITYSPLNTPVLDLTNDSASLPYNGNTKIGSDVAKSTGKLWLNGKEFSGTYKLTWEAVDESCSIIQDGNTVSVNALKVTTAIARCTVTEIEGYKETILTKDFIISKSLKGSDGTPGKDGAPGVSIKENKQWYILKSKSFPEDGQKPEDIKPTNNTEPTYNPAPTPTTVDKWMSTPPEAVNDHVVWTCYGSIFSDDTTEHRHIRYSDPVKDNAYALAQGKTTNYYSPTEPVNKIKIGDCWFDTGYIKISPNPDNKAGYLGKFVSCQPSIAGSVRVEASGTNRYIPSENGSTYLVKITPDNINKISITVGTTTAYETGNLKQWDGNKWKDIAGELVTNKLTANYINALDITAKKITVRDNSKNVVFMADATSTTEGSNIKLGNFKIDKNSIKNGTLGSANSVIMSTGSEGSASIAGSESMSGWAFAAGTSFGVLKDGNLYASAGKIGGFSLSANEFKTIRKDESTTSGLAADVLITNADQAYWSKVANKGGTDWRLLVGEHFGVNKYGGLHCDNADVKGNIIATSGRLEKIELIDSNYITSAQIEATNLNTKNLDVTNVASIAGFKLKSATTESTTITSKKVSLRIKTSTDEYVDDIGSYIGGNWLFKLTFACYDGGAQQSFINQHNFTNYQIYSATFESNESKTTTTGSDTSTSNYLTKIYFNDISLKAYKGRSTITATASGGGGGASSGSKWRLKEVAIRVNGTLENLSYFNGESASATVTIDYSTTTSSSNLLLDGGISINGDVIPYNTNWSIGDSSHKWDTLYVNNAYATAFYASSDKRLKKNIKEFEPKNSILNLPVVEFDFKNSNIHQIGCIAQDLQKICPELVTTDVDGYLSISENKLSYLLLLELKKLSSRVTELEQKLIEKDTNK